MPLPERITDAGRSITNVEPFAGAVCVPTRFHCPPTVLPEIRYCLPICVPLVYRRIQPRQALATSPPAVSVVVANVEPDPAVEAPTVRAPRPESSSAPTKHSGSAPVPTPLPPGGERIALVASV